MRLVCVARHPYLSEHLCRVFGALGAQCAPAVGARDAVRVAAEFEPNLLVSECDVLSASILELWGADAILADVPVVAVSLARRPDELGPLELMGVAAVVYLPTLDRAQVEVLLSGARGRRGVTPPAGWESPVRSTPLPTR